MEAQYKLLEQFVKCCEANPNVLHEPKLAFFRNYLESLGATLPPKKEAEEKPEEPKAEEEPMETPDEEEVTIPYPEIDNSGVIEPDTPEDLPMGEIGKEPTDEELERANDARDRAMTAFSEGNFEQAVKEFSTAIELNPGSAMMHAKRANALLKLNKPLTAIADCDKAIKINPDSAQGYKFRGRANRLLGKWIDAHQDLATACKLDYDDVANEWLKETDANAKKLLEYNRALERAKEEKELSERRERVRRAQEANKKAAEEAARKPSFLSHITLHKRNRSSGAADDVLGNKLIGLYFSAHWCPPCRQFTPLLKKFYEEARKLGEEFEIVFCSSDRSEEKMEEYMEEAHGDWYAMPFEHPMIETLMGKFGITGIPALVIVKRDGSVVQKDARNDVMTQSPMNALRQWKALC